MNIGGERPDDCECKRMPRGIACPPCTEAGFSTPANVVQNWIPKR